MRGVIADRLGALEGGVDPRDRFLANVVGEPSPEVLELIDRPSRQASVLMPIVERASGLMMLFTERAAHLAHHPGQVAFPGGRIEPGDASPEAAALREAAEEVGLRQAQVQVVGSLSPHITGTGFIVTPVVGFVGDDFVAERDAAEVAAVFEVPLDFLLEPANRQRRYRERFGSRFVSYEYLYAGWRIWGATAAMVVTLEMIINKTNSYD